MKVYVGMSCESNLMLCTDTDLEPPAPSNAFVPIGKRVCVCVCVWECVSVRVCVCVCLGIRKGSSLPVHMRLLL